MRNQLKLKQGAWIWDRHWSIKFPEHWIIEVFTHKDVEQLDESKMLKIGKQVTEGYVNRQIIKHDLIIGWGGIYPHSTAGFSGGAKLILGVCSIRTILHFHMKITKQAI